MKKTIEDFDLYDKKVIIRCDLNVPVSSGKILDDNRIKMSLKTIKYAIDNGAKTIILSHFGRIKTVEDMNKYDLSIVGKRLSQLLNKNVVFINETRGDILQENIENMIPGDVLLIQNTRYEDLKLKKESSCDNQLSKYWASLGDIFINDAFGTSHRTHASNVGISKYLPSGIGFLVKEEIEKLDILNNPKKPFAVILAGAKINDKIKVIDKLIEKADYFIFAGGIANTFLKAKGYDMGKSIYDEESIIYCKNLLDKYNDKIILPEDGYGSCKYQDGLDVKYCLFNNIPGDIMVLDVGPISLKKFEKVLKKCLTVFWNGPLGVSEFKNFEYGTRKMCEVLSKTNAKTIIGGGDSAAAAINFGYKQSFYHISTGGGASLEYVSGEKLPGIETIDEK